MGKETGIYQCPSCSQSLIFKSKETRIKVCTCGTPINRLESDDLTKKSAFTIGEHNDLIQVSTTGVYQEKPFEVIGRFRVWLAESVYNYWTILFNDGTPAFLAEGYGMYAILQTTRPEQNLTASEVSRLEITDLGRNNERRSMVPPKNRQGLEIRGGRRGLDAGMHGPV